MDPSDAPADALDVASHTPPESSTRPNPFQEEAASSRKRRRTSASASQSPARDTASLESNLIDSANRTIDNDTVDLPSTPKSSSREHDNSPPTTPPTNQRVAHDPSGSVTLSLRRVMDDRIVDMTENSPSKQAETPQQSPRDSERPAATPSHDQDMASPDNSTPASEVHEVVTPPENFPFRQQGDQVHEPVVRLTRHLSTDSSVDPDDIKLLLAWMKQTVQFMKSADRTVVLHTLQSHRRFWISFAATMNAIKMQRLYMRQSEPVHQDAKAIFGQYSFFIAELIKLDRVTLEQVQNDGMSYDEVQLFSKDLLHTWYGLLHVEEPEGLVDAHQSGTQPWTRAYMAGILLGPFYQEEQNTVQWIDPLIRGLSEAVITQQIWLGEFMLAVGVLSDCVPEFYTQLHQTELDETQLQSAAGCIRQSRDLWVVASTTLSTVIEKHIAILNGDVALGLIQALTSILFSICRNNDWSGEQLQEPDGVDQLFESHQSRYPTLDSTLLLNAVPWGWRLDMFARLIQAGPMHLRVLAANALCACLTEFWRLEKEDVNTAGASFATYLGEIVDTGLVDYIIGPSCHPEIIIGSANIIGFLVVSDTRTNSLIDRMWRSIQSSQDHRVAEAITKVITHLCGLFQYEQLIHLCQKFQELEMVDFSPMLRGLWETIMREMAMKAQLHGQPLTLHPYLSVLRVLRQVPASEKGVLHAYPDLHTAALQRARELIAYGLEPSVRHALYADCVKDLQSPASSSLGSLCFLSLCIRPAILGELQYLTETHDIVRLVVEELEHAVQNAPHQGYCVVYGPANAPRRDLISQIIHFQPKSIVDELGARLWEVLVGAKALNSADRGAAWQMISTAGGNSGFQNPFLQSCFSKHLPNLSPDWFCEGMLNFVKENVVLLVSSPDFDLDDDDVVGNSGIEHLWRIILLAHDTNIVYSATKLLISTVYLDSQAVMSCPLHTAQSVHLKLADRCLKLMREAASELQTATSSNTESIATTEGDNPKWKLSRVMKVLSLFLETYRQKPQYAVADLRSIIPKQAEAMKGDPTELQYQAFDDAGENAAKPLEVGDGNSVASLLATIRDETGFVSFRAYYRGRQLIPTEADACKSLKELSICDGLVLVKKDEPKTQLMSHVKPGSLPIEIEILAHFSELWDYLGMEEDIAAEIHDFLVKLPADGALMELIDAPKTLYKDIFASNQPFRSLYTIHALGEYVKQARPKSSSDSVVSAEDRASHTTTIGRALKFLVQALEDDEIAPNASSQIQTKIEHVLTMAITRLLDEAGTYGDGSIFETISASSASRLLSILTGAMDSSGEDSTQLACSCVVLILRLGLLDSAFWAAIAEDDSFARVLTKMCVLDETKSFREHVTGLLEDSVIKESGFPKQDGQMTKYFWFWAIDVVRGASSLGDKCHEVMRITFFLIMQIYPARSFIMDLKLLSQQLSELLANHITAESINQVAPWDMVVFCWTNLLHACLMMDGLAAEHLPSSAMWALLERHLLPDERNGNDQGLPRVILNPETRRKLYECVYKYLRTDKSRLNPTMQFLESMVPYNVEDADPYIYDLPFNFEQAKALRSPAGYVGLQNLSNTCYLNSLIVQLYMNIDFRKFLSSFEVDDSIGSKALLYETQMLFGHLNQSIRRSVEPSSFVGTIKTYDHGPIDIHNQMDVDEFYNLLFDRWEGQLPNPAAKREFRSFYGGRLVQQIKSKECDHISERFEPFSAIQCDIKGKSSLEESLQAYVGGETMEGDNKYKCSSCDRHVDAVKRACLKDVPDNVIFHLKRFDFNLQTLQRSKIDDYFAFPEKLNLHPYTIECLSGSSPVEKDDMFELVGVLVHAGTAESGHYYSYVRERPSANGNGSKWVEFNDDNVCNWDPAFMEESTFGGPDRRAAYEANGIMFDKSYSAYMLFYQRSSSLHVPHMTAVSLPLSPALSKSKLEQDLEIHIRCENVVLLRRHCLFDQNHAKFVQACILDTFKLEPNQQDTAPSQSIEEVAIARRLAMKTGLSYLDQIFSRAKETTPAVQFCSMLYELAKTQKDCARAILDYFYARPAVLRSLLLRSFDRELRRAVSNIFVASMETASKGYPELYNAPMRSELSANSSVEDDDGMDSEDETQGKLLSRSMELLEYLWRFFHIHTRAWDEYFTTILSICQLGKEECAEVLAANYLQRCLTVITADMAMQLDPKASRALQNIYRRPGTQPPSHAAVLALTDYLMGQLEPEISSDVIVESAQERRQCMNESLPWTEAEISLLFTCPGQADSSLFVLRLLEIDQARDITVRILERIIRAGDIASQRVLAVLENAIQGDATMDPLDAYIRAATTFLDCCSHVENAEQLLSHVCRQAGSFQNSEGETFLNFFQGAMNSQRESNEERSQLRLVALSVMAVWIPHLLQYPDSQVRGTAEQLVDEVLCNPMQDAETSTPDMAQLSSRLALDIGMSCLDFLQEAHIKTRTPIERDLAAVLVRVLGNCTPHIESSATVEDDMKEEFVNRRQDVLEDITRMMVDRVEDDGSDWEGSALSSEQMDDDMDEKHILYAD